MRSFEIPACGGFMIAEDTAEHREIFGPEGECVLYFANAEEAAHKTRQALADPAARRRMALAAHRRITRGANTYRDRLKQMLEALPA
jgi:spore maturation protein CgeB